jgi:hypothetical protein
VIAQLGVGVAGGVVLALLMSLIPVAAVLAICILVITTWIQLARRREQVAMLAGATLGSGLALLFLVTTTVQSCSQTSDFCGNANVVPLMALAAIALGSGLVASIATFRGEF